MRKTTFLIFFLFVLGTVPVFSQQTSIDKEIKSAVATINELEKTNRWVDNFSNQDLVELPVGVRKTIQNTRYSIGITQATFYPDYTEMQVYCKIDIPQTDAQGRPISLFFGADNVKLSHQGGIIGDAKLTLLGDVDIPVSKDWQLTLYGGFDMNTGGSLNQTYATIDCDGFKELKISGAVEFSENLIRPLTSTHTVNAAPTREIQHPVGFVKTVKNRVRGDFSFTVSSWNDILVRVDLEPFVLAEKRNGNDYEGNFQFLVNNAVLDFSDLRNDLAVVFPEEYHQNGLLVPAIENWRGVYVQTLEVALPSEFKTKDTKEPGKRVHIGASNMIIDKYGVSGTFYAKNIFPLDEGITDQQHAWAYSLNYLELKFVTNRFLKAKLNGEIQLPVSKAVSKGSNSPKGFEYTGIISQNEYALTVVNKDAIDFDIWKAKAVLLPNSSLELKVLDGRFLPKANLHGSISFSTNQTTADTAEDTEASEGKEKIIDFKGITFQDLKLQTVSPAITVGSMGYKGELKFGNFPVSIGNIDIVTQDDSANIYFDLGLNLMDSNAFSAKGRIGILGGLKENGALQSWRFQGLQLNAIHVNSEIGGLKLSGRLDLLRNDPIYGNGFNAELRVTVPSVGEMGAKAIFGKKDFRYWYFDASVKLNGGYIISGFGGGAYYKMKRLATTDPYAFSPSGLSYAPDGDVGLGLKALVYFSLGTESVFSGQAAFEMLFNSRGGINQMAIYGEAQVLKSIPGMDQIQNLVEKVNSQIETKAAMLAPSNNSVGGSFANKYLDKATGVVPKTEEGQASIEMKAAIEFDFVNNSLHGTLDVFINTPGDILSGVGPGGRAGWAVFHKDPKDWYLYIGTPDDRIGIKLGVAGIYLKTTSYLMAGTQLPGSPPPPPEVAEILGLDANVLNYMRDENQLANYGGFAFGSEMSIDTGDLSFLIFYARFKAGIGFDIMLKDYGEAECSNTGDVVGIDGWYANGQSYAYLQGELGVRIKLFFIKMKVPIISAGAAVLMQAKLPNPVWLRGYVGGYMNVLGGLIKGKFNFKLTIGKECQFAGATGILDGMKLIADVTPKKESVEVDVFAIPQATFSMKVNEALKIPEDDGDQTYKIVLERFILVDEQGQEIEASIEWTSMKDRANLISKDILPPNKKLTAQVEVSFQKMVNGVFQPIMEKGQVVKEIEERSFVTGMAPDHIPLTNIQYAYPVVDQKNFFIKEYATGYIQLKRGQDYLFDDANWKTGIRLKETQNDKVWTSEFNYDASKNEVFYELPKGLKKDKSYAFSIISANSKGDEDTEITTDREVVTEEDNEISVTENQAISLVRFGEIDRLSYGFKASEFETFKAKMNRLKTTNYLFSPVYADVITLENKISPLEPFDITDLTGSMYTDNQPLLQLKALTNNTYFTVDIAPSLYAHYPIDGRYELTNRDVEEYGIVPVKALWVSNYYLQSTEHNLNLNWIQINFPYTYNLPQIYKQDWMNLREQIANDFANDVFGTSTEAYQFLGKRFEFMRYGAYEVEMNYVLPGNKKKSKHIYQFKNLNKFR
ncbi:hypothetical protein [Flavobacterium sp. JP2137]|uniref:hypothetical protein n=1 Tax=Flavobacterium sp. JP2137 TaxID=3414510 RepID=UPI003D2FD202